MSFRRTSTRLAAAAGALGLAAAGLTVPSLVGTAHAAEPACSKFASTSGSDSASGTSTAPFRTATKLAASLGNGEVGCVRAGSYSGDVSLRVANTTLRSAPGERATLNVGTLSIAAGATGVTVSDLNIVGNSTALTTRLVGDRFTFTRNMITNKNGGRDQIGSCILVADSASPTRGGTITENMIRECGPLGSNFGHGIYTQNVDGLLIQDNVIRGVGSYAIQLYPTAANVVVRNNVIDGALGSIRGGIVIDGTSNNHRIERNVIAYAQVGAVQARVGSGHSSVNNCYFANPSNATGRITVSGDITADPAFVNRSAADYRLSAGSPCLAKVGYDTAAKVAAAAAPTTTAAPAPTVTAAPAPTATAAPAPTATAAPAPTATTAPVAPSPTATTVAPEPTQQATASPSPVRTLKRSKSSPTTVAPSVRFVAPTAGTTVGNDLRAIVDATSGNSAIDRVDLLINGRLVAVERSAPYDQWLSAHSLSAGQHTLTAVAYDRQGRSTAASVIFFKR